MNFLYKMLLTINATSWMGIIYAFNYPIGYRAEISDCIGWATGHHYTHEGALLKYGAANFRGYWEEAVYFFGHKDIEGWYPQTCVPYFSDYNYADNCRIDPLMVHEF